jgi:phytoene synthase
MTSPALRTGIRCGIRMPSLTESYEYCHELTQRTAHNFRFSFLTLSADRRRAMDALYAFNRITDDLGDEDDVSLELKRARLATWRQSLRFILSPGGDIDSNNVPGTGEIGTFSDHPSHPAIADMVATYRIPLEYLFAVIDGVEMDLHPAEIVTFTDLQRYCYHVAGAVGLCCIHVWGFHDERAISLASDCGLALQITNILRDIGEDADLGRIYLPREDLERFGYSADDLRARVVNQQFHDLMRFQVDRARYYYARSEQLFEYLEPPGKPILRAMIDIYAGLLHQIERSNFDVFSKRASLPKWKKIWFAVRAMMFSR